MESRVFIRFLVLMVFFAPVLYGASSPIRQETRQEIRVVGSSAVFPFAASVAEHLGDQGFKTPIVEATGTGGGIKLFCQGVGPRTPDIVTSSRPMKGSEKKLCEEHGVVPLEFVIGKDGIVLVQSSDAPPLEFSQENLFEALTLNTQPLHIMGPSSTSGTREALVELAVMPFCKGSPSCGNLRDDGGYIDAGENEPLIVQKVLHNPNLIGIISFGFYEANKKRLHAIPIGGISPALTTIADDSYPLARPLYLYVKAAHVGMIPGLMDYVEAFQSDEAAGEHGYLKEKGLIPLRKSGGHL